MFLKHKYPARVSGTAPAGEKTWRSLPDSSVGKVSTPTGKIRLLTNSPKFSNWAEKTVEVTFHTCGYKKKPPELLQVRKLQSKRRLPTLPLWRSTIGVTRLNFSVRNGKRWNPCAIATWIRLTYCWAVIVISFCSKNQRYTPSDI